MGVLGPVADLRPAQRSFDELDDPLREITFVVFDLETTGGSAADDVITEFGAVKVRGGEVLGEFATLVDPGRAIPVQISVLTGISDAMVVSAPRIGEVLPPFLEFIRGTVLVAHNARFDIGFLKAACARCHLPAPANPVVDTVRVARAALTRQEAPSVRLSALAELFHARTRPNHRALHDARATVDVLHGLFERLGPLGVHSLTELTVLGAEVEPGRRRKRHLADGLPARPGVYLFRGPGGAVLYVGTSSNLRRRVRSYFTTAEQRTRIREMVALADGVDHVECAHALEAHIREQRLIALHQPPYNRRSRAPRKVCWIVLTRETFPRLSVVARPPAAGTVALGPFRSRAAAGAAVDAIEDQVQIRRCHQRIAANAHGNPCALAELGRCGAPCAGGNPRPVRRSRRQGRGVDPRRIRRGARRPAGRPGTVRRPGPVRPRRGRPGPAGRVGRRSRPAPAPGRARRHRRAGGGPPRRPWRLGTRRGPVRPVGRRRPGRTWGRPMPVVQLLQASAETVPSAGTAAGAASAEETSTLLHWIEQPGSRLVSSTAPWSSPARGAGRWRPFMGGGWRPGQLSRSWARHARRPRRRSIGAWSPRSC